MKEQIYTIPVIDGFKEGGECPFCNMYKKLESDAVDYMLGPSYMEDDIRAETDKTGFCKNHYSQMYAKQNRLGLALMVHTHLKRINNDLEGISNINIETQRKLFSKSKSDSNRISPYLNNITNSCYVCNKINITFDRYLDTFFFIWKKKEDIKEYVKESNGFCLEHFSNLISEGQTKLNASEYKDLLNIIVPLEKQQLKRLEEEVDWFINKFDYRYNDQPWKTAKDALPRSLTKLSSIFVED